MSSFVDKVKSLFRGKQESAEGAIDKTADAAKGKVGHEEQADSAAEKAKEAVTEQPGDPTPTAAPKVSEDLQTGESPGSADSSQ